VYEGPFSCIRLCLKGLPGIEFFMFVSNGQAREVVALQGKRLNRVS
jgi:hypothetical protein